MLLPPDGRRFERRCIRRDDRLRACGELADRVNLAITAPAREQAENRARYGRLWDIGIREIAHLLAFRRGAAFNKCGHPGADIQAWHPAGIQTEAR